MTALSLGTQAAITPVPCVVPAVVDDRQEAQVPDHVQLKGMLGARIPANTYTRLLETVEVDCLLEGYRKRPGCLTWDGEHIGKWIHAASLAWANTVSLSAALHAGCTLPEVPMLGTDEQMKTKETT